MHVIELVDGFLRVGQKLVDALALFGIRNAVHRLQLRVDRFQPCGGLAGFGGAFLAMVGLSFFFDGEKEVHWIRWIEEKLAVVSNIKAAEIALLLLTIYAISLTLSADDALTFVISGVLGLVTFIAVEA